MVSRFVLMPMTEKAINLRSDAITAPLGIAQAPEADSLLLQCKSNTSAEGPRKKTALLPTGSPNAFDAEQRRCVQGRPPSPPNPHKRQALCEWKHVPLRLK